MKNDQKIRKLGTQKVEAFSIWLGLTTVKPAHLKVVASVEDWYLIMLSLMEISQKLEFWGVSGTWD